MGQKLLYFVWIIYQPIPLSESENHLKHLQCWLVKARHGFLGDCFHLSERFVSKLIDAYAVLMN